MRRVELEVTDRTQTEAIIKKCTTMRLGIVADGMPYIIPMVFGYDWDGELPRFYMHCGVSGRKNEGLYEGARVAFEMDIEGPITGRTPYANGYSREFSCIMGEGTIHFASGTEEKISYFEKIMEKQTGRKDYTYQPGWLALTKVMCLRTDKLSASQKGMNDGPKQTVKIDAGPEGKTSPYGIWD